MTPPVMIRLVDLAYRTAFVAGEFKRVGSKYGRLFSTILVLFMCSWGPGFTSMGLANLDAGGNLELQTEQLAELSGQEPIAQNETDLEVSRALVLEMGVDPGPVVMTYLLNAGRGVKSASLAANNAWVMICSALVFFMISPGLAMFYSGLVRKKNVLSVFIQGLFLTSIMSVIWATYGYSLAFTNGGEFNEWIGGLDHVFLIGVSSSWNEVTHTPSVPIWSLAGVETTKLVHMVFQGMFFSIAPVIICGALAERVKFHGMVVFSVLWGTFVYCPIAHWIWGGGMLSYPNGLLGGSLDFAGGSVVHVSAGVSALMAALVLGPRLGFGKDPMPPHNLTYTAIGAAMLWFGWFGFNAGSAMSANEIAANAFVTTHLAASAGALGWWLLEWRSRGKPTVLGVSSGLVAGLVCITPAAGFIHPMAALLFGLAAGIGCYYACSLCKHFAGYDDALDAFGIHGVAGIIGSILTGLLATRVANNVGHGRPIGVVDGGTLYQGQLASTAVVIIYSCLTSLVLLKMVDWTIGLRVSASDERQGLDVQQHGEEGYIFL